MLKAQFEPHILHFKQEAGTSRGVLKTKKTYFLNVENEDFKGFGECALFEGLSADDVPDYEEKLQWLCDNIEEDFEFLYEELRSYPSIQIGLEQALLNLKMGEDVYFLNDFTKGEKGIPINGLIWMGSIDFMKSQFEQKIAEGYKCIKFKIGSNWPIERDWLKDIRKRYPKNELEIRVDANGAFTMDKVEEVLQTLADLEVHSLEQPIKAGNPEQMAYLCENTSIPIALDEELIGVFEETDKRELLTYIKPQYIILKPSLVGGFKGSNEWIEIAENQQIKWWITSALESNVGLNAIAQFTASLNTNIPQGLGTGGLFTNNTPSTLQIKNCELWHH